LEHYNVGEHVHNFTQIRRYNYYNAGKRERKKKKEKKRKSALFRPFEIQRQIPHQGGAGQTAPRLDGNRNRDIDRDRDKEASE
jgi:hypothetical protein